MKKFKSAFIDGLAISGIAALLAYIIVGFITP